MNPQQFGLIGYPLTHSLSAEIFNKNFPLHYPEIKNAGYKLFPLKNIQELSLLLQNNDQLFGFNVTIPYKIQIIPFLHELSEEATAIGSVNTVKIFRKGNTTLLKGYNTDATGFQALMESIEDFIFGNALILGTGGASKAVSYVLQNRNIPHLFVSRNPEGSNQIGYKEIEKQIHRNTLIINTTPVGQYPLVNEAPNFPYKLLSKQHFLIDLVYNPVKTRFLTLGGNFGANVINGMSMLYKQAEKSWKIWLSDCY